MNWSNSKGRREEILIKVSSIKKNQVSSINIDESTLTAVKARVWSRPP